MTVLEQVKNHLGESLTKTLSVISDNLETDISLLKSINDGIIQDGGKMLRPVLTLLFAELCSRSEPNQDSIDYAAAVELLHNATLFHDDVSDAAEQRRGRPTAFKLFGPQNSVLIGDFWLVRAMELVLAVSGVNGRVMKLFSGTLSHLAEGQILEYQKTTSADTTMKDYLRIIYGKTASLFETSALCGAISSGANPQEENAAKEYALNLGIAFQIKDDLLDYTGEKIGKPTGLDLRERKITMPLLCSLSDDEDSKEIRRMIAQDTDLDVQKIMDFVSLHDGITKAKQALEEYVEKACKALEIFPDSLPKRFLEEMANYSISRNI